MGRTQAPVAVSFALVARSVGRLGSLDAASRER